MRAFFGSTGPHRECIFLMAFSLCSSSANEGPLHKLTLKFLPSGVKTSCACDDARCSVLARLRGLSSRRILRRHVRDLLISKLDLPLSGDAKALVFNLFDDFGLVLQRMGLNQSKSEKKRNCKL